VSVLGDKDGDGRFFRKRGAGVDVCTRGRRTILAGLALCGALCGGYRRGNRHHGARRTNVRHCVICFEFGGKSTGVALEYFRQRWCLDAQRAGVSAVKHLLFVKLDSRALNFFCAREMDLFLTKPLSLYLVGLNLNSDKTPKKKFKLSIIFSRSIFPMPRHDQTGM